MTRRLQVQHRYLLDLISDMGLSQQQFYEAINMPKATFLRLLSDPSYDLTSCKGRNCSTMEKAIVEALINFGIKKGEAENWNEWVNPQANGKPRIFYILEELGISGRKVEEILPGSLRKNLWRLQHRRIEANNNSPLVKTIENYLLPWLKINHGLGELELQGWFERITDEQRTEELIGKESSMDINRKERRALGLDFNPFTFMPYREEHFFATPELEEANEALMDAAEQGLMLAFVGRKGSGKSVARARLVLELSQKQTVFPIFVKGLVDKKFHAGQILDDLLDFIANINSKNFSNKEKTRLAIIELEHKAAEGIWYSLVIDEADKLSRDELLALKQLNELHFEGRRLLSIILFGQEPLARTLGSGSIKEFSDRASVIIARPLSSQLTKEAEPALIPYLKHRLCFAATPEHIEKLITPGAWSVLERAANSICHNYLGDPEVYPLDAHKLLAKLLKYAVKTGACDPNSPETAKIDDETAFGAFEGFVKPARLEKAVNQ